jgi:hypothetical protein
MPAAVVVAFGMITCASSGIALTAVDEAVAVLVVVEMRS